MLTTTNVTVSVISESDQPGGVAFELFVDGEQIGGRQTFNSGDLFHERVEEAVMNLLRPITNSAAAELRKLRRKAQANQ